MKRAFYKARFFYFTASFSALEKLKDILNACGLHVQRYEQVYGGDINEAWCLFTSTEKYFLKVNDKNRYPAMFEKETSGLDMLRQHCNLIIPKVIKAGEYDDQQYLLMEWLEKGSPQKYLWENFGEGLAMLHKKPQANFGLNEDNYIGSIKQVNTPHNEWHSFYGECRLMPLVKILFDAGHYSSTDIKNANSFSNNLKNIFPSEPPALLHGDLWGGNYMITSSGNAALFDPAVYFGHREMDIGMTKLFGGFDSRFYEAYHGIYPLAKGWEKRLTLTQLYPLLVHAVLFGGHYISKAKEIIKQFA